jgi:3-hydroxyisobutyrate dehydrogenase-like beta-hydroxyacid dehydrogenase
MTPELVTLIGFGELGSTLAADLEDAGIAGLTAWDRLFPSKASDPHRHAERYTHVAMASDMTAALEGCTFIISTVTAGECLAAARMAASGIGRDAVYLDLNSVSPEPKRAAARGIENAGVRYVEAAVMSPIAPRRIATSMLLGGPHAAAFAPRARAPMLDELLRTIPTKERTIA